MSSFNSIIYTDSVKSEVKDSINPYSFIEFITKANLDNSDSNFLSEYRLYLNKWCSVKNDNSLNVNVNDIIQQQVIDLLKIITLSYSSLEEQIFLSNLNWDFNKIADHDELFKAKQSIYSALPIFVRRIKDIASFYKKQRNEATFVINRNKIKGTQNSLEKIIYDKILTYLFNNNPSKVSYVQNYLNISIDNYVDTYSEYFDCDISKTNEVNFDIIDESIYFELQQVLSDMIFDGNVYLEEIPLIAQVSLDLSQDCVGDKLTLKNELIASNNLCLIPDTEKINLRKRLYSKYLGSDFYYAYKDNDNIVSDIFIKAEMPANNLLNQQSISTPTEPSKQLELLKNIGLFFKPDKMSILRVNTHDFSYQFNKDAMEDDKIYIFPDPNLYGNVGFNKQKEYPLIIEYSFDNYIKNISSGWASNDPRVENDDNALYSYYSRQQDINKVNKNNLVQLDFNKLTNEGFITQVKSDLYGNKFAIYKEKDGKFKRDWDITLYKPTINDEELFFEADGGGFDAPTDISADKIEWSTLGHNYKYFVEAGVSTLVPDYFRAYIPNNTSIGNGSFNHDINTIKGKNNVYNIDGASFLTDYNLYELFDADSNIPKILNIDDNFVSTLEEVKPDYSGNANKSYFDICDEAGKIYISLASTNKVIDIMSAFPWWQSKLNVYEQLVNNAIYIDIIENVLIIKSKDKVTGHISILFEAFDYDFENDCFIQKYKNKETIIFLDKFNNKEFKSVDSSFYRDNNNIYNKITDIFYVENQHKCYFVEMQCDIKNYNDIAGPIYYPTVYEIDLVKYSSKVYTFDQKDEKQVIESFRIPDTLYNLGCVSIWKCNSVQLAYSKDTNTFMLSYCVYDINNCPYITKHFFKLETSAVEYNGFIDILTLDSTIYGPGNTEQSTVVINGDTTVLNITFDVNYVSA